MPGLAAAAAAAAAAGGARRAAACAAGASMGFVTLFSRLHLMVFMTFS